MFFSQVKLSHIRLTVCLVSFLGDGLDFCKLITGIYS